MNIETAESLLNTKYHRYLHGSKNYTITRCMEYSLPSEIH